MFRMFEIHDFFASKSATTPFARRCNLVMDYLVTYMLRPFALTWPIAFLALIIVALVAKVFVAIPLKAFGACCCDKKPSAALSPERGSAASAVAMV